MNGIISNLPHYENLIKANHADIKNLNEKIRSQKEMLTSAYENDSEYQQAKEALDAQKKKVAAIKQEIDKSDAILAIKSKINELNEEKREIQQSLFDHLDLYSSVTHTNYIELEGKTMKIVKKFKLTSK